MTQEDPESSAYVISQLDEKEQKKEERRSRRNQKNHQKQGQGKGKSSAGCCMHGGAHCSIYTAHQKAMAHPVPPPTATNGKFNRKEASLSEWRQMGDGEKSSKKRHKKKTSTVLIAVKPKKEQKEQPAPPPPPPPPQQHTLVQYSQQNQEEAYTMIGGDGERGATPKSSESCLSHFKIVSEDERGKAGDTGKDIKERVGDPAALSAVYLGVQLRADAEKDVMRPGMFRVYHQLPLDLEGSRARIAGGDERPVKAQLKLFLVYRGVDHVVRHLRIRREQSSDRMFRVECDDEPMRFSSIAALVKFYSIYATVSRMTGVVTDIFPAN